MSKIIPNKTYRRKRNSKRREKFIQETIKDELNWQLYVVTKNKLQEEIKKLKV